MKIQEYLIVFYPDILFWRGDKMVYAMNYGGLHVFSNSLSIQERTSIPSCFLTETMADCGWMGLIADKRIILFFS